MTVTVTIDWNDYDRVWLECQNVAVMIVIIWK